MIPALFSSRVVVLSATAVGLTAIINFATAQTVTPGPSSGAFPTTTTTTRASTTNAASADAEKEEIWTSPDMLRARAWLKDYCSKSAKVTPEMAKEYEAELANMNAKQMKIWLMKFDEEEQQRQQQWAMFHQANQLGLQQAMAAQRQTQQAYQAIDKAETAAAQNAQQQINEQRQAAQQAAENKRLEQSVYPYGGGYGYGPYSPFGYGGINYHYHLY